MEGQALPGRDETIDFRIHGQPAAIERFGACSFDAFIPVSCAYDDPAAPHNASDARPTLKHLASQCGITYDTRWYRRSSLIRMS